jgi:hypothetical protein
MTHTIETKPDQTFELSLQLLRMIQSNWVSQAIYVAAELRLADALANTSKTSVELAGRLGVHPPALQRLLRALTTIEILNEKADGSFELTPLGAVLRSDSADSMRSWALYTGGYQWPIWGHLLDSIKTGQSARVLVTGEKDFEHLERNPAIAATFNQAMAELTRITSQGVVRVYSFAGMKRIVDIGGGVGELLVHILLANPDTQGVLFDLPHAIPAAQQRLAEAGLADRCETVGGSFFESVPAGGDVYILNRVIHDWEDERSRLILENCRHAMPVDGKLLLIERIVPERMEPSPAHQAIARSDLNMLIGPGGRERRESEFRALFQSAGFQLNRILPIELSFNVIEFSPMTG